GFAIRCITILLFGQLCVTLHEKHQIQRLLLRFYRYKHLILQRFRLLPRADGAHYVLEDRSWQPPEF
ncbi:MAG: hypothetical protein KDI41_02770, partial [Pseudomonadales bacterium]|nr:hypothetical protein [Pseudomonadales bacterium]